MAKRTPEKTTKKRPGRPARAKAPRKASKETLTLREYLDSLVEEELQETSEPEEASELWVSFSLAEGTFGLPVDQVREVLRVGAITRVPRAPAALRGVTNMRGRVLAVVDLRVCLGMEAAQVGDSSRVLVAAGPSGPVGLLVDRVEQMEQIRPSETQEPPDRSTAVAAVSRGVVPRQEGVLVLLDLEALLQPTLAA